MLYKKPKQTQSFWKIVKGSAKVLFVVEAVLFAASYGTWYQMNTNRDFRYYMNENFPYILEGYYKIGELLGDDNQKKLDFSVWQTLKKKSE